MATYAFRTYEERKEIQKMYEAGASIREIAKSFGLSNSAMHVEIKRGYRDDVLLPDMRPMYDADLAQLKVKQSLARRGRKKSTVQRSELGAAK